MRKVLGTSLVFVIVIGFVILGAKSSALNHKRRVFYDNFGIDASNLGAEFEVDAQIHKGDGVYWTQAFGVLELSERSSLQFLAENQYEAYPMARINLGNCYRAWWTPPSNISVDQRFMLRTKDGRVIYAWAEANGKIWFCSYEM